MHEPVDCELMVGLDLLVGTLGGEKIHLIILCPNDNLWPLIRNSHGYSILCIVMDQAIGTFRGTRI